MWCVIDPGLVVNPDGVMTQIEGGLISDIVPTFGMLHYIAEECEQ